MNRFALALAALGFVSAAPAVAQAQAVNRAAVQTAVIANEKAINDALVKNDMKAFHSYITADAVSMDGMGLTKAADFDKMMADYKVLSSNITDSQFMWLDDANVVHMYKWTGKSTYQGKPAPDTTWSSTIWSNRGGKWLAVFHSEAAAMPAPPAAPSRAAAPAKK